MKKNSKFKNVDSVTHKENSKPFAEWKVFLNVAPPKLFDCVPDYLKSQGENTKVLSKTVQMKENSINMAELAGKFVMRDCAVLYTEFVHDKPGVMHIRASADYWMEVYLNGKLLYNTMANGDGKGNHWVKLPVRMRKNLLAVKVLAGSGGWSFSCTEVDIIKSGLDKVGNWIDEKLFNPDNLPYSFVYDEKRIAACPKGWSFEKSSHKLDEHRTEHTSIMTDPKTGLKVICIAVQNHKYPAVEWTLWFENTGNADTPLLSDIKAIDSDIITPGADTEEIRSEPAVKLFHFKGDYRSSDGYEPLEHQFYFEKPLTLHPEGGNPSNVVFPYCRAQGETEGMIFVVSWQGQWQAVFQATGVGHYHKDGLHVTAGQEWIHTKLLPGEKIRTPMIVLMPYDGDDAVRIQNMWRRWFIEFNMPRVNGELIKPFYANYSGRMFCEMVKATEENQKQYIDKFLDNNVDFDYLWMDAGWYENANERNVWFPTGTWKPDSERFPNGIRAISDYAHKKGIKTILWFEPERVAPGTELYDEHPEWLLGNACYDDFPEWLRDNKVLDLGNNEARTWITDRINSLIQNEGVDLYRQDFNVRPLSFWRNGEVDDRQGIRENHYCVGYLKFWDNILAANPGIIIDSCASGGRRNDLETVRRGLPLHKTDYNYADLAAKHGMHHTLFQWLPFFGSFNSPGDQSDITYHRSSLLLSYHGCENVFAEDFDFKTLAAWMQEWRETAHCMYGDFYPLTSYSRDEREWIGWQFHLPESGEGMIQVFMRKDSPYEKAIFKLEALESDTEYALKDYNTGKTTKVKGVQLTQTGITVEMRKRPDSALYHYHICNN